MRIDVDIHNSLVLWIITFSIISALPAFNQTKQALLPGWAKKICHRLLPLGESLPWQSQLIMHLDA
jgi:hypothetical protein